MSQKDQVFNPLTDFSFQASAVDRPVDRVLKSVDRAVDRRAQTCTPVLAGGPVDRPDRPSRELCSLESPGRPTGRPDRDQCSLYLTSVDRPVDRWHNGLKYDRWPVTGRSTASSDRPQRLVFLAL